MAPPTACSTTTVFHTFLHGAPDPVRLAADGLIAKPSSAEELAVHKEVYAELFQPLLRRPFTAPGVFFSPPARSSPRSTSTRSPTLCSPRHPARTFPSSDSTRQAAC